MAIDPPYRLDPFRNIINIHWGEEQTTSGTFEPGAVSQAGVYGDLYSTGTYGDGNYYVNFFIDNPDPSNWTISPSSGGNSGFEIVGQLLTHNTGQQVYALVSSATSGKFVGGSWYDNGGENPPYGDWGYDISGMTLTNKSDGSIIIRPRFISNIQTRSAPYLAWLICQVHWGS